LPVSSDSALRAHLRKELGLNDANRVSEERLEAELQEAKRELSTEISRKAESGGSFDFYGDQMAETLTNYMKVRVSPLSPKTDNPGNSGNNSNKGGKKRGRERALSRIPADHPRTLSHIRRSDFGDDKVNFWRDRMVHHFNRI